jgi:hypothetical protein
MIFRRLLGAVLVLSVLLVGCAPMGSQQIFDPTQTPDSQAIRTQPVTTPDAAGSSAEIIQPQDATVIPESPATEPPQPAPYITATLQKLSGTCLRQPDYEPLVNRYLAKQNQPDLKSLWEDFDKKNQVYDLMSSLTDVTNTYALATTYSKMLLVGEYEIAINRPGAVGYAHCSVLVYMGGDEPEIGVGVTDATLNDTWSGFAYGVVRSEPEMRDYIQKRIGKAVIVRYEVSQDPSDVNFVRSGFFSPVMKLLWANSYFTRFSQNPDMLKNSVTSPRGPNLKELMVLLTSWPDQDIGIFIDYMIDPIL